jgi:hypothetical protein
MLLHQDDLFGCFSYLIFLNRLKKTNRRNLATKYNMFPWPIRQHTL